MFKHMMSQTNYQASSSWLSYPEMLEEMFKHMMSQTNYKVSSSWLGYPKMLEEMFKYMMFSDKLSGK